MSRIPCSNCRKECLSELVGTYTLVLIGPGTMIALSLLDGPNAFTPLVLTGLGFGLTVGTIIVLLGRRSGAHVNPAVTVACTVSRRIDSNLLAPYIFFQVAGALFAGLTLRLAFASSGSRTTSVQQNSHQQSILLQELSLKGLGP